MNRGMTLLEVLLALVMLSSIVIASAWLVQTTVAASSRTAEGERWLAAADAALDAVARDLASGDFDVPPDPGRIDLRAGVLCIATRAGGDCVGRCGGPIVHEYRFEPSRGSLWRDERPESTSKPGTSGRAQRTRLVLEHVRAWSVGIDASAQRVDVVIESHEGRRLERRMPIQ